MMHKYVWDIQDEEANYRKKSKTKMFQRYKVSVRTLLCKKSAWMTIFLIQDYLITLDQVFRVKKKKILLFIDICSSYEKLPDLEFIKVIFFPSNITSVAQQLNQGIIRSLKITCRKEFTKEV